MLVRLADRPGLCASGTNAQVMHRCAILDVQPGRGAGQERGAEEVRGGIAGAGIRDGPNAMLTVPSWSADSWAMAQSHRDFAHSAQISSRTITLGQVARPLKRQPPPAGRVLQPLRTPPPATARLSARRAWP
jgi:hypothetical protein